MNKWVAFQHKLPKETRCVLTQTGAPRAEPGEHDHSTARNTTEGVFCASEGAFRAAREATDMTG